MPTNKRRLLQTCTEALLFLAVAGLCSLALSGEKRVDWIRRPSLSENLADTPRLLQCMSGLVNKSGYGGPSLRFSGPILTKDRGTAWYFVYPDKSEALYRLEFLASASQKWRLFQYGQDLDTHLGAFTGRMETKAFIVDRRRGKSVAELDLLTCAQFLGQGIGHGN